MAQDLVSRRRDAASALVSATTDYLDATNRLTETLADVKVSGGDFVQTDFDNTNLAYLDFGVLNYLRDVVFPNIQATHNAPFDGTAGHDSNLTMLRKLARITS